MRLLASAAVLGAALVLAASARAGGVAVELAAAGGSIWSVSDDGLRSFSPGRRTSVPGPPTPYPFATRLAASGSALWVASVANGYTAGAVTRVDVRTGRVSVVLRLPHEPVWDVCAGGGTAWALVGRGARSRAILLGAGVRREVALPNQPGWCAADRSGAWVTGAEGRLRHVTAAGAAPVPGVAGAGMVAAGGGAVWAAVAGGVARVDERTGRARTFAIGPVVEAVAVGAGRVWALARDRHDRSRLLRLDPGTGRITASRALTGSPTAVLERGGRVWLGGLDRRRRPTLWRVAGTTLAVHRVGALGP